MLSNLDFPLNYTGLPQNMVEWPARHRSNQVMVQQVVNCFLLDCSGAILQPVPIYQLRRPVVLRSTCLIDKN